MPRWETRVWQPTLDHRPRQYRAFVPDSIAEFDRSPTLASQERCEAASRALAGLEQRLPVAWEPIARLLLRAEGLASSQIEGLQVTLRRLLEVQLDPAAPDAAARWVLANVEAVEQALRESGEPLSLERLLAWHARLMAPSGLPPRYIGRLRTEPGWIGGTTPLDAAFVPPPAEYLAGLLEDLIRFANRGDLPAVAQAAIVHAQFETIHPFGDGNGRVGRALIGWTLRRRGVIDRAVPPISPVLALERGAYLAGLHAFQEGRLDAWVGWFAGVAIAAAGRIDDMVARAEGLVQAWEERLGSMRADAAARRLLRHLPGTPVLDVAKASELVGASERAIRTALGVLAEKRILTVSHRAAQGPGRPRQLWIAPEVLRVFD